MITNHGTTSGYRYGCRCDTCRMAKADAKLRLKRRGPISGRCVDCGLDLPSQTGRGRPRQWCEKCRPRYEKRPTQVVVCPTCRKTFEQRISTQKYCRPEHRPRWTTKANAKSTKQRGYGQEHRKLRVEFAPLVEAGEFDCHLCGYPIDPGTPWCLDHTADRSGYRGIAHASCNARDGAIRGNRSRGRTAA